MHVQFLRIALRVPASHARSPRPGRRARLGEAKRSPPSRVAHRRMAIAIAPNSASGRQRPGRRPKSEGLIGVIPEPVVAEPRDAVESRISARSAAAASSRLLPSRPELPHNARRPLAQRPNPCPHYRSRTSTHGRNMAGARGLWRATGMKDGDFGKPIIAVVNSFTQFVPGHVHLKDLGQLVAREIEAAGGVAKEFNTIAVDDGIAMGHDGMLYSLPSREIIADSVEYMVNAHCADAMVCISNCDKITPGMLMAAMRLNIPTVFVSGGPMEAGKVTVEGQDQEGRPDRRDGRRRRQRRQRRRGRGASSARPARPAARARACSPPIR